MKSNIHTLKQSPLFLSLKEKSLGEIASAAKNKYYEKYEVVYRKGDAANNLFILKSGIVKISLFNKNNREAVLDMVYENDFFGVLSLFEGRFHHVTASAVTDCELLIIRKKDFIRVLKENPAATFKLLSALSHRLRKAVEKVESLAFFDAYGKTAKLLLELTAWQGHNQMGYRPDVRERPFQNNKVRNKAKIRKQKNKSIVLNVPFTRKEMAAMAGVTRETLNRMLNEFQTRGCLKVEGKKITILDEAILKREVA